MGCVCSSSQPVQIAPRSSLQQSQEGQQQQQPQNSPVVVNLMPSASLYSSPPTTQSTPENSCAMRTSAGNTITTQDESNDNKESPYVVVREIAKGPNSHVHLGIHHETRKSVILKVLTKAAQQTSSSTNNALNYSRHVSNESSSLYSSSVRSTQYAVSHQPPPHPSTFSITINTVTDAMRLNEVQHLTMCRGHPCIVQLENVVVSGPSENRTVCIVTEYIDGVHWGVSAAHKRKGPWDPDARSWMAHVRAILQDVLLALQHLHDVVGIAHMDIKPENVIVCTSFDGVRSEANAKLIDLGSSVRCEVNNGGGKITNTAGTLYYCSPEKIRGGVHSPYCPKAADIWALGITALVAIFGEPEVPYPSKVSSKEEFRRLAMSQMQLRIPETLCGCPTPPTLISLLNLMIHKDPEERPSARRLRRHPFFLQS